MKTASAPASSANLGPGYDVLAVALDLRCRVSVDEAVKWEVTSGAAPADESAFALVRRVAEALAVEGSFRVEIDSAIPPTRGLGSSAAIIAATAAALRSLRGGSVDRGALLGPATRVEGHPDNVAAALYGGLVMVSPKGTVRRLELHEDLSIVMAVPDTELATEEARRATADPVPTAVAVRTAARLGFLIEGLRTGDSDLLAEASGDELHEERRAHLAPGSAALVDAARAAGAVHAAWSGAGPAVVAFTPEASVTAVADAMRSQIGDAGEVVALAISERGTEVD